MNPMRHFLFSDGRIRSTNGAESIPGFGGAVEVQVVPLDAIVIDGPLPKVGVSDDGSLFARGADDRDYAATRTSAPDTNAQNLTPEWHDFRARQHLALAAHLRAHPPVDKAQVKAFNDALLEVEMDHPDGPMPGEVARRRVAAGYRIERVGGESR